MSFNDSEDLEEVVQNMIKFMKQTNEMLAGLKLQIDNFRIDIEKLKKEFNKYKNNGRVFHV